MAQVYAFETPALTPTFGAVGVLLNQVEFAGVLSFRKYTKMNISLLSETQHASMVDVLSELYRFYNQVEPERAAVKEHLQDNLLEPGSPLRILVAVGPDQEVAGFAAVSVVFSLVEPSAERNRQCAMKELYVRTKYRGRGIGQKLMQSVAQFAVSNGCHRIDWNVKAANDRGIAFYKNLGATLVDDRLSFRISGKKLELLSLASAPTDQ